MKLSLTIFKYQNIAPHLDRAINKKLRRPNHSKNCYISNDLCLAVANHCYQDDRTQIYHFTRPRGKVKYIFVFNDMNMINTFDQLDQNNHMYMGRNHWGILVNKIIKCEFDENSERLCDATYTWIQ